MTGPRYRDLAARVGDGHLPDGPLAVPTEQPIRASDWLLEADDAPPDVCPPQPITEAPFAPRAWLYHRYALCLPSGCRPDGCMWWPGWECEVENDG